MLNPVYKSNGSVVLESLEYDDDNIIIPKCMVEEFNRNFPSLDENFLFILGKSMSLRRENFQRFSKTGTRLPFGNIETFCRNFISALRQIYYRYPIESLVAFWSEAKVQDLYKFLQSPEECILDFI